MGWAWLILLLATYPWLLGADLATDFGRDVKNIIGSQEYRALFDTRLAEDSQANFLAAASAAAR
jgi:hypothetical protein